jgi:hypothetical protein
VLGVLLVAISLAVSCAADEAPPVAADRNLENDPPELLLQFDEVAVPGDAVPGTVNDGTAEVAVSVVTWTGGRLVWDRGWEGGGVRTPSFGEARRSPTAALVVVPTRAGALDPGTGDFVLQVDFSADPAERGRPGDDGDNLVQRGRYDDRAQLKLQLDHGVPACRVSGDKGAVVVRGDSAVRPNHWYRLTCRRSARRVVLRLDDLEAGDEVAEWEQVEETGEVRFAGVPISIGAKVADDGRIDPAGSDQFHGVIDRVVVDVS